MQVDIFTVGSDWEGYFDYLKDYCEVIYLERTEGISSSKLREQKRSIRLGLVGGSNYLNKVATEVSYVNGIDLSGIYTDSSENLSNEIKSLPIVTDNYSELLNNSDAVYIHSHPKLHYLQVKKALEAGKHVMCESPLAMSKEECNDLFRLAENNGCILMDTLRTAYATAFQRILLLVKGGRIGKVVSVDAVCTSLRDMNIQNENAMAENWNSITAWGPTALLPIFQILGTNYREKKIISHFSKNAKSYDTFSKIDFIYDEAVASIKVGVGVKSEGVLIISGTKGYVYVPAPWWKTDYFEIRYENPANNRKYFYQLDGEGIRYEFASFAKATENGKLNLRISKEITESICTIMEHFEKRIDHISI
jgi:choline-phosphate cytidylyltransferase